MSDYFDKEEFESISKFFSMSGFENIKLSTSDWVLELLEEESFEEVSLILGGSDSFMDCDKTYDEFIYFNLLSNFNVWPLMKSQIKRTPESPISLLLRSKCEI